MAQRRSLAVRQGIHGEAYPLTIQAHFFLARRMFNAGDMHTAESELLIAREQLDQTPSAGANLVRAVHSDLVFLYKTTGDTAKQAAAEATWKAVQPGE